jgi:hypothetical protein
MDRRKVSEKAAKKYSRAAQLSLLVYANFNGLTIRYDELLDRTARHRQDCFSIWIITQGTFAACTRRKRLEASVDGFKFRECDRARRAY